MQVFDFPIWKIFAGPAVALLVSYLMTPPVKRFAENVGAIDVPKDARRVHDHPIPRMGGLAIFTGFVLSVLLFVNMSMQVMGLLLDPWIKLGGQFLAALVAIRCGIVFDVISNPGFLDGEATIPLGWLSIPFTIMWIIACTNAVNLIDGLDGLAVGISAISSISMMIVSMILPAGIGSIPLILACLAGACFGFMPYNINPAKIFMGDVGSQFLGYVLSCVSIIGLFKFHAIITFLIPLLSLAVPLGIHHKLIDMGMSQKQAVAVLYAISAVLGLIAVLVAGPGTGIRIVCIVVAFAISLTVWLFVFSKAHVHPDHLHPVHREGPAAAPAASSGAHAAPSAGTESREKQERVG